MQGRILITTNCFYPIIKKVALIYEDNLSLTFILSLALSRSSYKDKFLRSDTKLLGLIIKPLLKINAIKA
jgi:hypothetical protein